VMVTSFYRTQARSLFLFSYLLHFNCKFVPKKNHRSGKAMVIGVGVTSLYKNDVNYFFIIPGEEEYMKKDC
ncbi:hypothetical protein EFS17_01490, partial [Levilactobacillus brevis]|nr:hypothetical protein [Levilactobacillus brevis]